MEYDFDKVIDRHNTYSTKWDYCPRYEGIEALPMWVADMDFEAPKEIIDAIVERANHGIFGYTPIYDSYYEAVKGWMKRRHGWEVKKDWIVSTPGVVPAVCLAILTYTRPDDKVVIQSPVYHPFHRVIKDNGRVVAENRLRIVNGRYEMDYENLERLLDDRTRLMILCSPHNPVGRVWGVDELKKLAGICIRHHLPILSDEIHSDLIMEGHRHRPTASLSEEIAHNTITCTSASKTFNLASLACANIIIPNRRLFNQFNRACKNIWVDTPNIFGLVATEAGYRFGEEWLEQLLGHIKENYDFLFSYLGAHAPKIKVAPLEGTYLAWLDFRGLGLPDMEVDDLLLKDAKVWLDSGPKFGSGGEGFQRINLACPRVTIREGLNRIVGAVKGIM